MIVIAAHEIADLRKLADDAKCNGKFDDGELLHTLLDSHEAVERVGGGDLDELAEAAGRADDLQTKVDDLTEALTLAADDLEAETGNFDDLRIEVDCEIDRLKEAAQKLVPAAGGNGGPVFEVIGALTDSVTQLRGVIGSLKVRRDRLKDAARRAREAL